MASFVSRGWLSLAHETPSWSFLKKGPAVMRVDLTIDPNLDGTPPGTRIPEGRI
jgi:hypothetical protein